MGIVRAARTTGRHRPSPIKKQSTAARLVERHVRTAAFNRVTDKEGVRIGQRGRNRVYRGWALPQRLNRLFGIAGDRGAPANRRWADATASRRPRTWSPVNA